MSSTQSAEREYILGTHDAEAKRLGFQHRLWSDLAHDTWKLARIKPGWRVLDVGCGPGFASMDLAQIVTSAGAGGLVVGVDESARYVAMAAESARRHAFQGEFLPIVGDVQRLREALATKADELGKHAYGGSDFFHMAFVRWVLCFVPDPGAVLGGVSELLRPRGRLCVNDYFNYESMALAPRSKAFERVIEAVGASWRSRGGDPDIVGRLPGLCREAGLSVTHLRCEQRVARPGDSMWMWPDTFFRIYVPTLVEHKFLAPHEGEAFFEDWEKWSANGDAFMHLPPVYQLVGVKG